MTTTPPSLDQLNLYSRTSTFLSVDVVESTIMKTGENEQDVIYTFLSYQKLIHQMTYTCHGQVINIAGDGLMCRFERPDDAAEAVRLTLNEAPNFNKRQNRLNHPFRIRMGVHTGEVYESQALSAGQLISHTLDLAAKLQQSAQPNHARFSQETVALLKETRLPLTRLGWNAKLNANVYEYNPGSGAQTAARTLPQPLKILVLEEDLNEILKLKKVFSARRYESLPTYDLNQAAMSLTAWQPHVVLISGDLPWDSGWEFLKSVRANQSMSKIPILLTSRQTRGDTVEKCFGSGANGFLRKPLEEQQILKRVEMVLREFYL